MTAKPNGADRLADAFRDAMSEAVEPVREDVRQIKAKMDDMETAMQTGFDDIRARLNPDQKAEAR